MSATALGLTAGTLTTAAWVPQLVRIWRSQSAADLSWSYLCVFGVGVSCWFGYGIAVHDLSITLANGVTDALVIGVCAVKLRVARIIRKQRIEDESYD